MFSGSPADPVEGDALRGQGGAVDRSTGGVRSFLADRQTAEASFMLTKDAGLKSKVDVSNGGLLSIAVLVSGILLTTSVLVHVATRGAGRNR